MKEQDWRTSADPDEMYHFLRARTSGLRRWAPFTFRVSERKKAGLKKARKAPQFSKR